MARSRTVNVTVRGAGIFGLSVAWACVRRGARVQIVAPNGIGDGASGGIVGALAPHTPDGWNKKKQFQFDSLLMAEEYWAEVAERGGADPGYARSGRLQPLADDRALELAKARAGSAAVNWCGAAIWEVTRDLDPDWSPRSASGWWIRDSLSARILPRAACAALAAACQTGGAVVVPEAGDRGAVVWATGWRGLLEMSVGQKRPVGSGVKGQAALLRLDCPQAPQLFANGLHVVPHHDGTVAVGSTSERDFGDPDGTDGHLETLTDRARTLVPALREAEVLERWAGVRPRAHTRAPMIGAWPGRPGHFIANGGFKIGFGIAPKVGEVMADLVLEGRDAIPESFLPEASFPPA